MCVLNCVFVTHTNMVCFFFLLEKIADALPDLEELSKLLPDLTKLGENLSFFKSLISNGGFEITAPSLPSPHVSRVNKVKPYIILVSVLLILCEFDSLWSFRGHHLVLNAVAPSAGLWHWQFLTLGCLAQTSVGSHPLLLPCFTAICSLRKCPSRSVL